MRLSTLLSLVGSGQLRAARAVMRLSRPLYRASWLATAGEEGLLRLLGEGSRSLADIAGALRISASGHEALASWLQVGVILGDLSRDGAAYALSSTLARRLSRPDHDPILAVLAEITELHHRLLQQTPARLRQGRPFTLADQDGELVARSSRVVEPFIHEAVSRVIPAQGAVSLLEIGCGTGTHLRHAAARNPDLVALGLELQRDVAAMARRNVEEWGLAARVQVESGDIRERPAEPAWDVVTLHQNVYYFPVDTRVDLLRHVRGFLKPHGRLLLTTACQGGSTLVGLLDLWGAATEGCGRLPAPDEMVAQMQEAGFGDAASRRLLPGESLYAFVAKNPAAAPPTRKQGLLQERE